MTCPDGLLTIDLNDGSVLNYRRYDAQDPGSSFLCDIKKFDLFEYLGTEYGNTDPEPFPEKFDLAMLDYTMRDGSKVEHDAAARKRMHNMVQEAKELQEERKFKRVSIEEAVQACKDIVHNADVEELRVMTQDLTGARVEWDGDNEEYKIFPTEDYGNAFGDI